MVHIPTGVWPVMLTPFNEDRQIDWPCVDALVDWYIDSGVAGIFTVCLSSEMYHLTDDERLALAEGVVNHTNGRVPVVAAGTFAPSIAEKAEFVKRMADTGVEAVVVITCQMAAQDEPDATWQANTEQLLNLTDSIPLGLYECPEPYKRVLTPELLGWTAETGRFHFIKDTCCDLDLIHAKLKAIEGTPLRFFNAEAESLRQSLLAGGHGFSGIAANMYPELFVQMCHDFKEEDSAALQLLLSVAQGVVDRKYPVSAKHYLRQTGQVAIQSVSRTTDDVIVEHDHRALMDLAVYLDMV